ncbi:MAG: DUF1015 domain-containing protein [Elusimicrobiota bacterium]
MPKIIPFCATRYSKTDISDLICPPYDIISDRERQLLLKKSPYNAVRIELPENYSTAKQEFDLWKSKQILVKDKKPAFYFYEQSFKFKGKRYTRCGFFALLKTEKFGNKGGIFPHEKTYTAPKLDRLNLLKATNINTSPIFCLFSNTKSVFRKINDKIKKYAPSAFTKSRDISEKMWVIDDDKTILLLKNLLKNNKILIADGHHRYETFYEYTGGGYILVFLCPFEDKGLLILPTHRLVKKWTDRDIRGLFRVFKLNKEWNFKFYIKNRFFYMKAPNTIVAMTTPIEYLHSTILKDKEISYTKNEQEAIKKVKSGEFAAAVIVKPLTIKHLKSVVDRKIVLPQKSTYFYPKVSTGVVFNELG